MMTYPVRKLDLPEGEGQHDDMDCPDANPEECARPRLHERLADLSSAWGGGGHEGQAHGRQLIQ